MRDNRRVIRQADQSDNVGYLDGLLDGDDFREQMEPHIVPTLEYEGGEPV